MASFDRPAAPPAITPEAAPQEAVAESSISIEPVSEPVPLPTAEDIERIHEEARQSGYDAGFAEGKSEAEKQSQEIIQETVQQLATLTQSTEQALAEFDQSVAVQLLDLALEVARQLTAGSIKANPDFLLPVIREALSALPLHHAHVTVHLHPEDVAALKPTLTEFASQNSLQIHENAEISRGGCRLSAGSSEIDANIETRWARVLEAIGAEPQKWLTNR